MAADPVQEQAIELGGERAQAANARKVLLVARQWRHAAQPAVRGTVIDLFQPGPQPGIEVVQAVDLGGVQFAEELVAAGAMPAFELAFALGGMGPARSEERRVGKEWVSPFRSRWVPDNEKKKKTE